MDYEIMMNGNVKIGQMAPEFEGISTQGPISLSNYKGKWVVLFSHPRWFYPRKVLIFGWIYENAWYCLKTTGRISYFKME